MVNPEREVGRGSMPTPTVEDNGSNRYRFRHTNRDFLSIVEVTSFTVGLVGACYEGIMTNTLAVGGFAVLMVVGGVISIVRPKRS